MYCTEQQTKSIVEMPLRSSRDALETAAMQKQLTQSPRTDTDTDTQPHTPPITASLGLTSAPLAVPRTQPPPKTVANTKKTKKYRQQTSKPTYYARKVYPAMELQEETINLQAERDQLQAQVDALETEKRIRDSSGPAAALFANTALRQSVRAHDLSIAETHSMFNSQQLDAAQRNPLQSRIHLPVDATQRRHILLEMRDTKIHEATEYLLARTRFLDPSVAHKETSEFTTKDRDMGFLHFDTTPFPPGVSVKCVYEAVGFFLRHQEFAVIENSDVVTIRESEETDEATVALTRFFSRFANEVDTELNLAIFNKYIEADSNSEATAGMEGVPEHGVVVINSVEKDELYPYQEGQRVRQDATIGILICEYPAQAMEGLAHTGQVRKTVSMIRWGLVQVRRHPWGFTPTTESVLRHYAPLFCDVQLKFVRERVKAMSV